jgi:phosphate transport system substrate-binding protein
MRNRVISVAAVGGLGLLAAGGALAAGNYQISGSTLVQPAFNAWCVKIGGNFCTDSGGGSGAGITNFVNNTVDWAASDAPLGANDLATLNSKQRGAGVRYFVTLIGGIAVPTHFSGEKQAIKLSGPVIAGIFDGTIKKWNAPQITSLNKGVKLPNTTIVECVRGDSSGTSYNFTNYLSKVSRQFRAIVGPATKQPNWKGTLTSFGKGGSAEASCIQGTGNAIGYVDYANTVGVNKWVSLIQHYVGKKVYFTAPNPTTIANAAAQAAKVRGLSLQNPIGLQNALLQTGNAGAYPIALTSFLLSYQNYTKIHAARESASSQWAATQKFINYAISPKGQSALPGLHFAKIPAGWVNLDKSLERTVKP